MFGRVTTADVAAARSEPRPVVVRMVPAGADVKVAPATLASSMRRTAGGSPAHAVPAADHSAHEAATLRPHMVHLGLAINAAEGAWLPVVGG